MAIIIDIQPGLDSNQTPVWLQVFSAVLVLVALIAFIWSKFFQKKSIEDMSEEEIAEEQQKKLRHFRLFLVKIKKDPMQYRLGEMANHPNPEKVASVVEQYFFKLITDNEDPKVILRSLDRLKLHPRQRFTDQATMTLFHYINDSFKKRYQDHDAMEKLLKWKAGNNDTPFSVWFDLRNQTILPIPESTQVNVRRAYEEVETVETSEMSEVADQSESIQQTTTVLA